MSRNKSDDWQEVDDVPPARRVSVQEAQGMTGAPPSTWVAAAPARAEIVRADHWTERAELQRMAGDIVRGDDAPAATGDAFRPMPTVREIGTPTHRALATLIRAAPLVALALPVSVGLVWLLNVWWAWLLPVWGLVGVAAYLAVVLWDLQYNSPSATERHRINRAAQVETLKLRQAHELRRAIVEAWLKHMEDK